MSVPEKNNVYVCSLGGRLWFSSSTVRDALWKEMERFGHVLDVRTSRSFAFVHFSRSSSAARAEGRRLTLLGEVIGAFLCAAAQCMHVLTVLP